MYPFSFFRFSSQLYSGFIGISTRGIGKTLRIQAIGGIFSFHVRASRRGRKRPQEETRPGQGRFLIDSVIHRNGVIVCLAEQVAGLFRQIQITGVVAQIQDMEFSHLVHTGIVHQSGRNAGMIRVGYRPAVGVFKIEMHA